METVFPYRREHSKIFGTIYRPIVPVELKWKSERTIQRMYLDSGADVTLLPRSVGDSLKFEITDDIREMRGVLDIPIPIIIKNIDIKFCDIEFPVRVAWAMIEEVPLLLGRLDVFDKFEIMFMQKEKKIVLYSND